jgi:hypothetical protein
MNIVAAAIKLKTGLILTLPKPARHSDIMNCLTYPDLDDGFIVRKTLLRGHTQGFLLADGIFVDRDDVTTYYKNAGFELLGSVLTSEDLW